MDSIKRRFLRLKNDGNEEQVDSDTGLDDFAEIGRDCHRLYSLSTNSSSTSILAGELTHIFCEARDENVSSCCLQHHHHSSTSTVNISKYYSGKQEHLIEMNEYNAGGSHALRDMDEAKTDYIDINHMKYHVNQNQNQSKGITDKNKNNDGNDILQTSYGLIPDVFLSSMASPHDGQSKRRRIRKSSFSTSSTRDSSLSPRSQTSRRSLRKKKSYQHREILDVKDGVCFEMRSREQQNRPSEYLSKQPYITPQMRAVLFDWLSEVGQEFVLKRQTIHFAYNYIDRYLTKAVNPPVPRTKFQLVGVTALWIATKIEELLPPKLRDFALATDGACSEQDILAFEQIMLKHLDWVLLPVTCCSWVCTYLTEINLKMLQMKTKTATAIHNPSFEKESKTEENILSSSMTIRSHSESFGNQSSPASSMVSDLTFKKSHFHQEIDSPAQSLIDLQTNSVTSSPNKRDDARSFHSLSTINDFQDRNWVLPGGINFDLMSRIMDLVDHFLLYPESTRLLPSRISAAILFFVIPTNIVPDEILESVTKYTREEMLEYLQWINNFGGLQTNPKPPSKQEYIVHAIPECDKYTIQRHHPHSIKLFLENLKKIEAGYIEFPVSILTQAAFDQMSDRFGNEVFFEEEEIDDDDDSFDLDVEGETDNSYVEEDIDANDEETEEENATYMTEYHHHSHHRQMYEEEENKYHVHDNHKELTEFEPYIQINVEMSLSPERLFQANQPTLSDLMAVEELEI